MSKQRYELASKLKAESLKTMYDPYKNETLLVINGAGYDKLDLLVIYKIHRMFLLNVIDEEKCNYLINQYHQRLQIEGELNYLFYSQHAGENDLTEEQIKKRETELNVLLKSIEEELEQYHLLPEYMDIEHMIDEGIKNNSQILERKQNN